MKNEQNTYNQPSQGAQQIPIYRNTIPRKNSSWRQRLLNENAGRVMTIRQERTIPNWVVGSAVMTFFVAFAACTFAWGYPMQTRLMLISAISLLLFFYGGRSLASETSTVSQKQFLKRLVLVGVLVRLAWGMLGYFYLNMELYGYVHGDDADTGWYMDYSKEIVDWLQNDMQISFHELRIRNGSAIDDVGYPMWLAILYILSFQSSDIIVPFIFKAILGGCTAIFVYHIASRHFGEGAARLAAIFVTLNPNMIFWCANMFKECELVFLCTLFVDQIDKALSSGKKLTFRGLLPGLLVGLSLFFFRAALGIVAFLAILAHVVMASNRVMSFEKKVIAAVLVLITLLVGVGESLRIQTRNILEEAQSGNQNVNMEWRSSRKGGNEFAKYAGKTVFAPLIFTIPFPTFNQALEEQILQPQLSGGYFIKNVFSFFVIYVMFVLLLSGEWRKHVFIIAYTVGYLACLALSSFAQSGRFHMPIWPMLMLFAAYGIQLGKTTPKIRRWWPMVLVAEVIICLAWNWFKLKGRGMI